MCKFTVAIPEGWSNYSPDFINALTLAVLNARGTFDKDNNVYAGSFFVPTPYGSDTGVGAHYLSDGRNLDVEIDFNNSPYDCAAIENYVKTNIPKPE